MPPRRWLAVATRPRAGRSHPSITRCSWTKRLARSNCRPVRGVERLGDKARERIKYLVDGEARGRQERCCNEATTGALRSASIEVSESSEVRSSMLHSLPNPQNAGKHGKNQPPWSASVPSSKRPSVFISYSWSDENAVRRLVADLEATGVRVLWDKGGDLRVGDHFPEWINTALAESTHVCLWLTPNYLKSFWCGSEYQAKLQHEAETGRRFVLPLLAAGDERDIPMLLKARAYADFREDYERGLASLFQSLELPASTIGLPSNWGLHQGDPGRSRRTSDPLAAEWIHSVRDGAEAPTSLGEGIEAAILATVGADSLSL